MFKTGDLVRYRTDGVIEFLGRSDEQVKIRGFRIELGEVRSTLEQYKGTSQAVALCREDTVGEKRLVGYVVPMPDQESDPNELRLFLEDKLPAYMVPSALVFIDSIPLTFNGKLDQNALPIPDQQRTELQEMFVPPRTPIEKTIADIWVAVLNIDQVGIFDNFFESGGHSLLATQIVSRIRQVLQVELPLRQFLELPTIANLAEKIEAMRLDEQKIELPAIESVSRENNIRLSFAQERLWFLEQLESDVTAYTIRTAIHISGVLDLVALERTLNELIRRHESMRTTVSIENGLPCQVIPSELELNLSLSDLSDVSETEREGEIQRILSTESRRPFDLSNGPLIRATLLKWREDDHILLFMMHHIISDGWSMGILFEEISDLYRAFREGDVSPLPELPIQYADFAHWQRKWFQGEVLENQLAYWKNQLDGIPAGLEFPTDRPRPTVQSFRGAAHKFKFDTKLTKSLMLLSGKEEATLFMTLLTTFKILLYRFSGQTDIVVGSPIANRNRRELEGLIGLFVNTLVLRSDISGNPTFTQLLTYVKETCLQAYAHQDLPFEKLVAELHPPRDLSRHPLFQVMFILDNTPSSSLELADLSLKHYEIENDTAAFDLTLSIKDDNGSLLGLIEYCTDLYEPETIERIVRHYLTLLESIVSNPEQNIDTLPMITVDEQQRLLNSCCNAKTDYPSGKCIHQLFEEQVERTPDKTAVISASISLNYNQLNDRANQLAHLLQELGVEPNTRVGIYLDRSLETLVAVLGTQKAGGAYVALDPIYPKDRLAHMIEDSGLAVLLTTAQLASELPENQAQVVRVDADGPTIARQSKNAPKCQSTADNLAYILYTSGSTGKPKGVQITHRNVVNFLHSMSREPGMDGNDIILSVTTLAFDISVLELLLPMTVGARVVIASKDVVGEGIKLQELLKESQATVMQATPATWRILLESGWSGNENLKALCGGETLPRDLAREIKERVASLWNMYGPTETTVWSSIYQVQDTNHVIPIGRPIDNTEIYILDKQNQPTPIGVPGELHIGGDGLAKGYLNRPELTKAKFIPHPFNKDRLARLYKSGDLARFLPDGNIEIFGRIDEQVKIRGFRIELGEIRSILEQHNGVKDTAVVCRGGVIGENQLVAYVVPNSEESPDSADLRRLLKEKLPSYMVPSVIVFIDSIPLTANGKVDHRGLPDPEPIHPELEEDFEAPATPTENVIAEIWQDILGIEQVGVYDNFFDLGGHSLLSTQFINKLDTKIQVRINIADVMGQTLGQVAAMCDKKASEAPSGTSEYSARKRGKKKILGKLLGAMKRSRGEKRQLLK